MGAEDSNMCPQHEDGHCPSSSLTPAQAPGFPSFLRKEKPRDIHHPSWHPRLGHFSGWTLFLGPLPSSLYLSLLGVGSKALSSDSSLGSLCSLSQAHRQSFYREIHVSPFPLPLKLCVLAGPHKSFPLLSCIQVNQ